MKSTLKHFRKSGVIISIAVIGFCLSINNPSWADTLQENNLNIEKNPITTAQVQQTEQNITAAVVVPLNQTISTEKETPCKNKVDFNNPTTAIDNGAADTEKNIVPVLDLKGGIQSSAVKKEAPLTIWLH